MTIKKHFPYLLITLSLVGLFASFFLMLDTISLMENPETDLPCNLNPFISCGNAILSKQGQIFGFPNPILGLISFSLLFGVALSLIYHVIPEENLISRNFPSRSKKIFWALVNLGTLASIIFVIWFAYESLYVLGSLCLYCLVVWLVTWPIFLYTTIWNIKEGHFSFKKTCRPLDAFLEKHHILLLILGYILLAVLIFAKFKDFFLY